MFKFLSRSVDDESASQPDPGNVVQLKPGHASRQALLDEISEFLLINDLDVNPGNLALAHAAFSGSDLALGKAIAERQIAREPIHQAWLDRFASPDEPAADEARVELDRIVGRLDSSLASFSAATHRAHGSTAEYGETLQAHVGQLTAANNPGETLEKFVAIARAMMERTREVESEMRRSSEEADALRASLERARREAEIDHLTGLPNRRAFENVLAAQYREAQQEIDLLSVAICDIDRFKLVNDTHGHDTGDRVIQAIGQVLAKISDDRCHVARHGGEEFVMLFRGRSVSEAQAMLDQAREQLSERHFINRATDEPIGTITFSGGVANVFAYADPREALRAADEALYLAKSEGRNRICTAKPLR